ncbi:MAG: hypothetical protein LBT06_10840 [Hungatella sp.]|jgi:hypothetical protein|nr:hypothetical protein [Hungatella sp.]
MNKKDFLDIREIRFGNREDAERVLNTLKCLVEMRGFALSENLLLEAGYIGSTKVPYYGWTDLSSAYIYKSGEKYALALPKLEKFIIAKEIKA